ncbi:zincin-like metallopeptidase domain-containing protein [Erysipelothrix anatis]|uniref:zincin-like metallopeptidase domain-containing protein n=1 Tax=Erysipelothrix anatis TaxID=2683713 RepID=UPI00135A1D11|nr:zincin-like metallopeptidase domain-containing protein [Erysipelothrix anatis]
MTNNTKRYNAREDFADRMQEIILDALEHERIPWESPVKREYMLPINGVTNKRYQSTNELTLTMIAQIKGYEDPRWVTFKQAKEQGWFIKKGEKSSPIIYTSVVDRRTNQIVTQEYVNTLSKSELETLKQNTVVKSRLYKVFNGSQVSGIPKLEKYQVIKPTFEQKNAEKILTELSENMGVSIYTASVPNAFYEPGADRVTTPSLQVYDSFENYASTLIHELAHATGHPKRLDRVLDGNMRSLEYATEELVAEFTDTYISAYLGIKKEPAQYENHKAYCQSWYQRIKDNPELLRKALSSSTSAKKYMLEQTSIQLEEPKKPLEINAATLKATVQIEDYATDVLGLTVVQSGQYASFAEHDSCLIYPNNSFYRFSTAVGGSVIDFIMHFEEVEYKEAMERLTEYYLQSGLELREGIETTDKTVRKRATLELPTPADNNEQVIDYLSQERGIGVATLAALINSKNLYQDLNGNCVFVSYDKGIANYAMKRGTYSDFKGDVKGSVATNGFVINNGASQTVFTEGIIDALSIMELIDDPKLYNYVSVNGVGKSIEVVKNYIEGLSESKQEVDTFIVAYDNDEPGQMAIEQFEAFMHEFYPLYDIEVMTPEGKDFNEDLTNTKEIYPNVVEEPIQVHQKTDDTFLSVTISESNCLKTYTEEGAVKKIFSFPKGSQYSKYIYTVEASQIMNVDPTKNTVTLQFNEADPIEVIKGKRVEGVYTVMDQQFIKAYELLRAYRNLEYEPESKQHVRLSKNDIVSFKEAIDKNNVEYQKLIRETDSHLQGDAHYIVERSLIVELQKQTMEENNEGIRQAIEMIENQANGRNQQTNQHMNKNTMESEPELEIQ